MQENKVEHGLSTIFSDVVKIKEGKVAAYIGRLAKVDPDQCSMVGVLRNGNVIPFGDSDVKFSIQSVVKPFIFLLLLQRKGIEHVRKFVGVEAAGDQFNTIKLDSQNRAPNPLINSGAIACSSHLLADGSQVSEEFEKMIELLSKLAGRELGSDINVYQSEQETSFRNNAIAALLAEHKMLGCPVEDAVKLYTMFCSIEVTAEDLAMISATLSNAGKNPKTGEQVITDMNVLNEVLSVMMTCGMYDAAGKWVAEVGMPAKSGVGGGVLACPVNHPEILGLGFWGPRLDKFGNSVQGVTAAKRVSSDLDSHFLRAHLSHTYAANNGGNPPTHTSSSKNDMRPTIHEVYGP